MKEVNTQKLWSFKLGTQEGINVPIWIIVVVQQRNWQDSQILNNDIFYRPPVTSAQYIIGTESYTDSAFLLNYNDVDYSEGYGQIEEVLRVLTKEMISFNHMNVIKILGHLMMVMKLDKTYTFSIETIRKI